MKGLPWPGPAPILVLSTHQWVRPAEFKPYEILSEPAPGGWKIDLYFFPIERGSVM